MRILDFADGYSSSSEPTSEPFPASLLSVTPTGNLASDQGQNAFVELQGDIDTINNSKGAANGIATLGSDGKVLSSQIPSIAITDVNIVADITARNALTVEKGDVAKVLNDGSGNAAWYIYDGTTWQVFHADSQLSAHEADTSTHGVSTVAGLSETQTFSNKTFSDAITGAQISTPSNPSSGFNKLYFKSDGGLYKKNSSGVETQIDASSSSTPAGSINMYAGSSAPSGWLFCDGSAISRTTYSALFTAIGTTFGAGDGSTTFNLPDTRGIFVRGAGTQTISSINYSGTLGTKQGDQMQGHYHSMTNGSNIATYQLANIWNAVAGSNGGGPVTAAVTAPSTDGTNGTPRTGSETRPANISFNYMIKT